MGDCAGEATLSKGRGDVPFLELRGRRCSTTPVQSYRTLVGVREPSRQGLKFDDCIALLMENRPEYIIWWLGLTKIGVRIALINTNLR